MYKHILVPLDGSHYAEAVLPHAQHLAQLTGARVTLLNVVLRIQLNMPGVERIEQQNQAMALDYLKPIQGILQHAGVNVATCVTFGQPAEAIVDVAEQQAADIITMSSRGIGATGVYGPMGSVAFKVMQIASCPVLLLRGEKLTQPPA